MTFEELKSLSKLIDGKIERFECKIDAPDQLFNTVSHSVSVYPDEFILHCDDINLLYDRYGKLQDSWR